MKRIVLAVLTVLLAAGMWTCKKESKYPNETNMLDQLVKITESLTRKLDRAKNRVSIGKAVTDFVEEYKRLKADMDKLLEKYPDLRLIGAEKNAPKELKPYFKRVAESLARMRVVLDGKASRFGRDKTLLKIIDELKEVMYYY